MCEKLNFLLLVILGLVQRRHKSSDSETSHLERYMYLAIIERERERERERKREREGGGEQTDRSKENIKTFFFYIKEISPGRPWVEMNR